MHQLVFPGFEPPALPRIFDEHSFAEGCLLAALIRSGWLPEPYAANDNGLLDGQVNASGWSHPALPGIAFVRQSDLRAWDVELTADFHFWSNGQRGPVRNLIVEVDGDEWHRSTRHRDLAVDRQLECLEWSVFRFAAIEVLKDRRADYAAKKIFRFVSRWLRPEDRLRKTG